MLFDVLNHLGIFRYNSDGRLVKQVIKGEIEISGGVVIDIPPLKDGQYYAILGSDCNDGVYQYGEDDDELTDEKFVGKVYILRYNKAFFDLVDEMSTWNTAHAAQIDSAYQSESFGGYSYSKDASASSVFGHFKSRLDAWRKV